MLRRPSYARRQIWSWDIPEVVRPDCSEGNVCTSACLVSFNVTLDFVRKFTKPGIFTCVMDADAYRSLEVEKVWQFICQGMFKNTATPVHEVDKLGLDG
jgi:hypothetical protein